MYPDVDSANHTISAMPEQPQQQPQHGESNNVAAKPQEPKQKCVCNQRYLGNENTRTQAHIHAHTHGGRTCNVEPEPKECKEATNKGGTNAHCKIKSIHWNKTHGVLEFSMLCQKNGTQQKRRTSAVSQTHTHTRHTRHTRHTHTHTPRLWQL